LVRTPKISSEPLINSGNREKHAGTAKKTTDDEGFDKKKVFCSQGNRLANGKKKTRKVRITTRGERKKY